MSGLSEGWNGLVVGNTFSVAWGLPSLLMYRLRALNKLQHRPGRPGRVHTSNVPKHAPSLMNICEATTFSVNGRFEGHYFYRLLNFFPNIMTWVLQTSNLGAFWPYVGPILLPSVGPFSKTNADIFTQSGVFSLGMGMAKKVIGWSYKNWKEIRSWCVTKYIFWLAPPEQRYWQNREITNVGLNSSVGKAPARQSRGRRFKSCSSSNFVLVHPNLS